MSEMGIDRALLGELPFFPESAVYRRGLTDRDYVRNGRGSRGRIKPKRRAEYIGCADNPCPRTVKEHVVPGVNGRKPRGKHAVLVSDVIAGRVKIESLPSGARRDVRRTIAKMVQDRNLSK